LKLKLLLPQSVCKVVLKYHVESEHNEKRYNGHQELMKRFLTKNSC